LTLKNKKNIEIINIKNQHIRMIFEGSCDTEGWSNNVENLALPSQEYVRC